MRHRLGTVQMSFVLALVTWVVLGKSKAAPADLGRPFLRSR